LSSQRVIEELFDRFAPSVHRRARRILRDETEAWDVVQQVFQRVLESQVVLDDRADPMTYLYRVTTNLAIDILRKRKRESVGEMLPGSDLTSFVESRETLALLGDELTERQMAIVVHLFIDGMTQEEASDVLKVSRKTVVREVTEIRSIIERLGFEKMKSHG
jgi:RNA polymerase sigma-70 factor (ECF subfamily)